ncbi:MAG: SpoIIE family protein phosphatase [Akkermansia sp.]
MDNSDSNHQGNEIFTWEKVKLALDAAEEGFYIWDIKQGIIHYTKRCLTMMGYPLDQPAPNIFTESAQLIHPEDRTFFDNEVRRYMDGHFINPMRIEIRILNNQSGGWRWVRINGRLERGENRIPESLVGVFVDITRRKTSELRSADERELFMALIERIPNNIYVKNRESRFIMANTSTAKKLGVPTPSDLIGKTDASFFDHTMSDVSRQEEVQIMESGKAITGRVHHETWQDGTDTWGLVSKFPWYSSDGAIKGIVGISSDVTKLVETEREVSKTAKLLKERNEALEKELDLAREIQLALLPYAIPSRSLSQEGQQRRVDFHNIFAPSEGVAGDWFNVFPVGNEGIGIIICDVMGHGIRAALIASMLRGLMEQLSELASQPAPLLTSLNRQLARILSHANTTMFASAVYAYIDLQKKSVSIASAGHPAPILLNADGSAEKLILPRGMAMGLLENATYQSMEMPLTSGMSLLLYTDGLTEAADATGDELGHERVIQHLENARPTQVKEMIQGTLKFVAKFTGCSQLDDDICMLGMKYTEEELRALDVIPLNASES